jgi:hypothetical protein
LDGRSLFLDVFHLPRRHFTHPGAKVARAIGQDGEFGFADFGVRLATAAIDFPLQHIGERSAVVAAEAVAIVVVPPLTTRRDIWRYLGAAVGDRVPPHMLLRKYAPVLSVGLRPDTSIPIGQSFSWSVAGVAEGWVVGLFGMGVSPVGRSMGDFVRQ